MSLRVRDVPRSYTVASRVCVLQLLLIVLKYKITSSSFGSNVSTM